MTTNHVSVRLDVDTMARVDALGPAFSTDWHVATRSDILRGLILEALDRHERGAARDPRARSSRTAPGAPSAPRAGAAAPASARGSTGAKREPAGALAGAKRGPGGAVAGGKRRGPR